MKVNGTEKFHRYLGIVAAEDDSLDEELEQLLALGSVRHGEQRVEVLEDMAESIGIERLACHPVDLRLHMGQVVLEQPEIPLLQRKLGANGLKPGAAIGDSVHQPVHLRARLVDADEQRGLLAS